MWTNADGANLRSVVLAAGVAERIGARRKPVSGGGTTLGKRFETAVRDYLDKCIVILEPVAPHNLSTRAVARDAGAKPIMAYAQFAHLAKIEQEIAGNAELQAVLGGDYVVDSDILIGFDPIAPDRFSGPPAVHGSSTMVARDGSCPILHASVSCKWTMRRDRNQNTRLEALNLVRNRKGRLPHIVAVTMECDPEILASLCLGTGDIDCVYHGALHELREAAEEARERELQRIRPNAKRRPYGGAADTLERLIAGNRLRDIGDLPLDLLV